MSDGNAEPNVEELQQTAHAAREALLTSISRLDERVKEIKTHAVDATAASGWGIAAAFAWWLSFAIDRRPRALPKYGSYASRIVHKPSLTRVVLTTAIKAAGLALTGVLLYSSYRRARRLGIGTHVVNPLPLPARTQRLF